MPHKVLLLARELGLGGTERQLAETALSLDRARFEPHVGCFTSGGFRARELREAIANRDIRLHYVGRHELATGHLVASVGYLRWMHPVRREVRPAEFVSMAETTGLATDLSRAVSPGCWP